MTITPHLLAGSAAAVAITNNPFYAFLIGFVIHLFIDVLPHVDPGTFFEVKEEPEKPWPTWIYIFAISEFIIIWAIIIFSFQNSPNFGIILWGGLGGITIDILDNNPLRFMRKFPIIKQLHWLHEKIHYDLPKNKWFWGIPSEIIVIGVSIWLLLKY